MIANYEILMVKKQRPQKTQRRVVERVRLGLCLALDDDGKECQCKASRLGVCTKHHQRLIRAEMRISTIAARKAFRDALWFDGFVLDAHEILQLKTNDMFARRAYTARRVATA